MAKRIEFFLYPGVVSLDVSGPLEVFSAATQLLHNRGFTSDGYETVFSALTPGPVRTSSGLSFHAELRPGQDDADILLIPGGMVAEEVSTDPQVINAVTQAAKKAKRIVSVCSGAFILANCGLLHGKRATTHWLVADRLAKNFPEIEVDPDAIYVRDGNISTSAGVTAGIDLALAIVEEDYGTDIAMEIARVLLLYRRRPGHQSQFSSPLTMQTDSGSRFSALIEWMEDNLSENLTVERLAEQANMSPRTFARIFPSETGLNPGRFVEQLRIDRARELIESGAESLETIARDSGFGREERLRRAFQRRLGISPGQYRAHFIKEKQDEKRNHLRDIHL